LLPAAPLVLDPRYWPSARNPPNVVAGKPSSPFLSGPCCRAVPGSLSDRIVMS
jgi:hypothetical protein